jgi:aminobenzoyl-glutamate utilization protein B
MEQNSGTGQPGHGPTLTRRRMLQAMGAGAATTALATADQVYAATTGYDESQGVTAGSFEPRKGLAKQSAPKDIALDWINKNSGTITNLSDEIWMNAELSLREWESSWATAQLLRRHGFNIEWGTAGLPTAYIATFRQGTGKPVLGFNGECDALPGLSQKKGVSRHDPLVYEYDAYAPRYGSGHGDAHNTLGAGAVAAAIATSYALRRGGLNGTVKFFGAAGEEQLVGKAYAVKAGAYSGLDAFLDWHPGAANSTSWGTNSGLISASFTFLGSAGHGGTPIGNKSGLDAAMLTATMSNFLRETHLDGPGRMHQVIANAGSAPNVTPDIATIWFYFREGSPARIQLLHDLVAEAAKNAAAATQTKLVYRFNSGCWPRLGNKAGAELAFDNMQQIGPPSYTQADQDLAKAIQAELGLPQTGIATTISPLAPPNPTFTGGASSDMGDVSWQVPVISAGAATKSRGGPGHNWHITSQAATNIGHQGLLMSARYLAATAVDLVTQPDRLAEIQKEFKDRTSAVTYKSLIPDGTQPPIYQPPDSFLRRTQQQWPPPGITWPVPPIVSHEPPGTAGPALPPVT